MDLYQMNYIDIDNRENEISYINDKVKDYINNIFKNNKCNEVCTRMTINFYQSDGPNRIIICGYNSKDVKIAKIDYCPPYDKRHQIDYLCEDLDWGRSNIKNKDIIKEYNIIHDEIINKYF